MTHVKAGSRDDDNPGTFDVGLEESDKVTTNPVRRGTEDETKEECVAATVTHMIGFAAGKL